MAARAATAEVSNEENAVSLSAAAVAAAAAVAFSFST